MNYFILTVIVAAMLLQNVAKKQYNKNTNNKGTYIFNSITTLSAALFFLCTDKGGLSFETAVIPYVLGFALTFGSATLFSFLAIREGSLSLTSLVTSYSLIIPTLYGLLFLNEGITAFLVLGIILLLISLFLVNSKKGDVKITLKWLIFVILAFLGNGFCSTIQTAQQRRFNGNYKSEFMIVTLLLLSAFFFCLSLKAEKGEKLICFKAATPYMVLNGIANALVNLLVMVLVSKGMAASIMFPVISGGGIVLTTLVAIFIYKEKLSVNQYIGLLLGTVSVVLMNI